MPITGRCLCGAVSFTIEGEPIAARTCWCRVCQAIGAGSATVNILVPSAAMQVTGELSDYESVADSGVRMHRRFCPRCGTHMFSDAESRPHVTGVRAGTLDDPELARPQVAIWTAAAPSWACIADDIPHVEGQPPPA